MSTKTRTANESFARRMLTSDRVQGSARGVIPATIAMPFVLRVWSPLWFVILWTATYALMSLGFASLSVLRPSSHVERSWSISAAVLFASVVISASLWSGQAEHYWAASTIGIIFIAFEMSALPFLRIGEWRVGVVMVGTAITVCGVFVINPIVALAFAPIVLAMVMAADRIRKLKLELEEHLTVAQRTIRHDPLTGLLNRRGLTTEIEALDNHDITVALIDVDRFKIINDTHGHQVGDQVLIAIAAELFERFGDGFHLARLGGDEFVAVAAGAITLPESIARTMRVPIALHRQESIIECGLSIGVSYGHNVDSAHRLLSEAGFAMRDSKRSGSTLSRFGDDLSERLDRTVQVAAIANGTGGAFVPHAQAIVADDQIVGCELLIRWERPDGQLLLPAQFLPMATEAGLMATINDVMLEHAVKFAARFNNRPTAPFVSVNISAPHLSEAGFGPRVAAMLREHRVPAGRLMIEITETEQLGGYGGWERAARELRDLGVMLAMDDFGSGYSSMERLQHLPISYLKFDRSLVQSVSGPFGEIVRGVSQFARAVQIGIIAEGIETLDELESMRAFDIAMFQGYLFHRPEPLDQVEIRIIEDQAHAKAQRQSTID